MIGVALRNPGFRRVWLAQVVSQGGDWFGRVAVLGRIQELQQGDAPLSVGRLAVGLGVLLGVEQAARLLPTALMGPFAGPVADRLPRRGLMVLADLLRMALVLAILTVDRPSELPLLYALVVLQMGTGIFFDAARSAALPSLVPGPELHEAYALSAATWSAMLSVGSFAGGLLVAAVGIDAVIALDAFSYAASALLLLGLRLRPAPAHPTPWQVRDVLLFTDMRLALAHVRDRGLTWIVLTKAFWGAAGAYLVMQAVAANVRFGDGLFASDATVDPAGAAERVATATGVLFGARGLGTGIGPLLARRWHGTSRAHLLAQVRAGFWIGALGYAGFAFAGSLVPSVTWVILAHAGGSALWVASTILWQEAVDDRYRGRVYTLEFLAMTLAFSVAGLAGGWLFDLTGSLRATVLATCAVVVLLGLAWSLLQRRVDGRVP